MPNLDRLPTAEDGLEGIMKLVDLFGEEEVFRFIGYVRDHKGTITAVSEARQRLAASMLHDLMKENQALDYEQARRELAKKLGYKPDTRTNLYKLIEAGEDLLTTGPGRAGERAALKYLESTGEL
ncbi:hypothetical protein [Micromonospora sp. RV43]|uniref:hypothetical protein n=1 Tax=Micromonospora sp. RV43 TaxID=1661387 RepID=UPI00064BA7BC|nr:hypothetical protein [Micromonospora sp. RV43]